MLRAAEVADPCPRLGLVLALGGAEKTGASPHSEGEVKVLVCEGTGDGQGLEMETEPEVEIVVHVEAHDGRRWW
jgi:hypothetical protein